MALHINSRVDHVIKDAVNFGGGDIRSKVIFFDDFKEESAGVDMLQIDVFVLSNEDLLEEGDELSLADLAIEGQVGQFVEPFIQSIRQNGLLGLVLLVVLQLHCQDF